MKKINLNNFIVMRHYSFLIFLFISWSLFTQNSIYKIKLKIDGVLIGGINLPIKIERKDAYSYVKGKFDSEDTSYSFIIDNPANLEKCYTFLIINYKNKLYEVPIDPLYKTANFYPEFRNIQKLNVELKQKSKLDKYTGVFGYFVGNMSVSITGYGFYDTSKSYRYKEEIKDGFK